MVYSRYILTVAASVMLAATVAGAEDLVVQDKTYRNVRVDRVEPDGVTITHSAGICKLSFNDLPAEWKGRYGYDPVKSAAYQELVRDQMLRQRMKAALSREEEVRRTAERKKLTVDCEILERQGEDALAAGTCLTARTEERQFTNEEGRVSRYRETRMIEAPVGTVFIKGLSSLLVKGSRWSGVLYPLGTLKDGHPVYVTSVDQAVSMSLTGALAQGPKLHPFLRGLGDGLTWPLRVIGYSDLRFAPPEDREFRYACGAIIGGCAYLVILIPFFRRSR